MLTKIQRGYYNKGQMNSQTDLITGSQKRKSSTLYILHINNKEESAVEQPLHTLRNDRYMTRNANKLH